MVNLLALIRCVPGLKQLQIFTMSLELARSPVGVLAMQHALMAMPKLSLVVAFYKVYPGGMRHVDLADQQNVLDTINALPRARAFLLKTEEEAEWLTGLEDFFKYEA
jgi:hypothetical protein